MIDDAVTRALRRVFAGVVVEHLRADSPLRGPGATVPFMPADAVALADAVAQEAAEVGARCELVDEDFSGDPWTFADLSAAVERRWEE